MSVTCLKKTAVYTISTQLIITLLWKNVKYN